MKYPTWIPWGSHAAIVLPDNIEVHDSGDADPLLLAQLLAEARCFVTYTVALLPDDIDPVKFCSLILSASDPKGSEAYVLMSRPGWASVTASESGQHIFRVFDWTDDPEKVLVCLSPGHFTGLNMTRPANMGPQIPSWISDHRLGQIRQAFRTAMEEYDHRHSANRKPTIDVAHGRVVINLTNMQRQSERFPSCLRTQLLDLDGRSLASLVITEQSRSAVNSLIASIDSDFSLDTRNVLKRWDPDHPVTISDEFRTQFKLAISDYQQMRVPLCELSVEQRLAYLDEYSSIEAKVDAPGFRKGFTYPMSIVDQVMTRHTTTTSEDGRYEQVKHHGVEMAITVEGEDGKVTFVYRLEDYDTTTGFGDDVRDLNEMLDLFVIPDIPDLKQVRKKEYNEAMKKLDRLEIAISSRI